MTLDITNVYILPSKLMEVDSYSVITNEIECLSIRLPFHSLSSFFSIGMFALLCSILSSFLYVFYIINTYVNIYIHIHLHIQIFST